MRTIAMTLVVTLGCLAPLSVQAQADSDYLPDYARAVLSNEKEVKSDILQVECSSCGTLRPYGHSAGGCSSCGGGGVVCSDGCASGLCKPGRNCKYTANCGTGFLDTFFGGLSECLCCPDPCYEPVWVHTANAAFFQDTVRPKTYTRLRFSSVLNMSTPRIAEYFFSSNGPATAPVDARQLSLYQEIGSDRAAFFIETPYRSVEYPNDIGGHAHNGGFADINLGTKTLLLDCELLQLSFQFRTFLPTGSPGNGMGTGHVSLEPSVLASLKLFDATYLQTQVAYWIPLGGNQEWAGAITHYHLSFNHLFVERGPWQVIGTAEFNSWLFTDGFTVEPERASGKTYMNIGPGLRVVYCDNYDFGFGYAHALSEGYLGRNEFRAEFRLRF